MTRTDQTHEAGFSLIEVLAALAIFALALSVLFGTLSDGLYNQRRATDLTTATQLAQSLLSVAGTQKNGLPDEGFWQDQYRWTREITPYRHGSGQSGPEQNLYEIDVKVFKGESAEPLMTLSTLRFLDPRSIHE